MLNAKALTTFAIFGTLATTHAFAQTTTFGYEQVEGHNVFFREAGPQNAKTIVLLHGFPSSSHMFRDLIPKLATKYHVIAPDYIGFGYSDTPSPKSFSYTFENLARITDKFLEQRKVGRYALYMQDYGGPVGSRIAGWHPERVSGLVIQNSNAYEEGLSEIAVKALSQYGTDRNPETEKLLKSLMTLDGIKFQYTTGTPNPIAVNPDFYTLDAALFASKPDNTEIQLNLFADYQSNVRIYGDWQKYFRTYQPKTLVLWGKGDPFFTVAGANAYKRDLKNIEVNILDAGHFALEEMTDYFASKINGFLSSVK